MKLSFAPWAESLDELIDVSRQAEDLGLDTIWLPELHRSATVPLAAVATATRSVRLGSAIMLAFVRSPMVTALEALDLNELSGGRFVLGLGSGVQRLNEDWHHARWGQPVAHLRETVTAVRGFLAQAGTGGDLAIEGEFEPVRMRGYQRPFPPARPTIPIYLASVGPAMTRLAGRIGDGWLGHELSSPQYLREGTLPVLRGAIAAAGRSPAAVEVVASACCVPHEDGRLARRWAAGLVAFYATVRTYDPFFEAHGFLAEARAVQAAFREGNDADMIAAVPDELVDAVTIAGEPDEVADRLRAYDGLADNLKLSPPTHLLPPEATRVAQRNILKMAGAW